MVVRMTATRYWSQSLITAYSTTTTGFGGEVCVVLASDYDALAAKLAEVERTAARYTWLKSRCYVWSNLALYSDEQSELAAMWLLKSTTDAGIDAAIDAEIEAASQPKAAHDNRTDVSVQSALASQPPVAFCPQCGLTFISSGWLRCPQCGAKLPENQPSAIAGNPGRDCTEWLTPVPSTEAGSAQTGVLALGTNVPNLGTPNR